MASTIYLRSTDGSDSDNGSTWALAKATLAAALTAAGAGGTVYVSQVHAETQASAMALNSSGTAASPTLVICVNDGAEPPTARATTATVSTTGASSITFSGVAYYYGITFTAGSSSSTASFVSSGSLALESCGLVLGNTSTSSLIGTGQGTTWTRFINVAMTFGSTSQSAYVQGHLEWVSTPTAILGATIPTTLFGTSSARGNCFISGVDLSALGSGKTLVNASIQSPLYYRFANCKLGASVVISSSGQPGFNGAQIELINCDSADTNYRYQFSNYRGDITQETTIVRTGGSSDGTTPLSHKFVTSANSKFYAPLYGPWVTYWIDSTGSVTIEAEVVTDNVTLTDAQAWIEVESLNNGSFPISTLSSDQVTDPIFGTPANQTTSSVTWTTTGLTTPVKQTLSKAVTTAEKGPIRARVVLAKASTTMYVDNLRLASSARQWQAWSGNYINDPVASGGGGTPRFGLAGAGPSLRGIGA